MIFIVVVTLLLLGYSEGFVAIPTRRFAQSMRMSMDNVIASKFTLPIAELSVLDSVGNVDNIDEVVNSVISENADTTAIVGDILQKLAGSPAILAVPIGAGLLLALAIGFGISKYSGGSDN